MADRMFDGGVFPVNVLGKEAWIGGVQWEPGRYRFQATRIGVREETQKPELYVECTCLNGPDDSDDAKGRIYKMFFDLREDGENPPVNYFVGYLSLVAPWALQHQYLQIQGDRGAPNLNWVVGGPQYEGCIFDCLMHRREYIPKNQPGAKPQKRDEIIRGTVQLVQPSGYAMATLQQAGIDWRTALGASAAPTTPAPGTQAPTSMAPAGPAGLAAPVGPSPAIGAAPAPQGGNSTTQPAAPAGQQPTLPFGPVA